MKNRYDEEKRNRIVAAVTVVAVLLILILVVVLIYQIIHMAALSSTQKELLDEYLRLTSPATGGGTGN